MHLEIKEVVSYAFKRVLEVGDAVKFEWRNGDLHVTRFQWAGAKIRQPQLINSTHQVAGAISVISVNN